MRVRDAALSFCAAALLGGCAHTAQPSEPSFPVAPILFTDRFEASEGLTFNGRGELYVGANRAVWRMTPDGGAEKIAEVSTHLGQAGIGETDILAADFGPTNVFSDGEGGAAIDGAVWRIAPDGSKRVAATGIRDPNAIVVMPGGQVLVSNDGTNAIYRLAGNGKAELWTDAVPFPNGMVVSQDGRTVYAAQIFSAIGPVVFDGGLWAIEVLANGDAGAARRVADTGASGADGLAIDRLGRVYIADNQNGRILRYDPESGAVAVIAEGMPNVASLVFGEGDFDHRSLYATTTFRGGGKLWRIPVGIEGAEVGRADILAGAQSAQFELDCGRIDRMLEGAVAEGRTVGASALVWKDGAEACFEQAGAADREAGRPFARDTLVQIFSMTKPVTGVALMQLWEQGKFGLDDPLERHLPQFAGTQVFDHVGEDGEIVTRPPGRKITVRDVLRHTAGFTYGNAGHPSDPVWDELEPLSADHTLAEFADRMAQVPLLYDPGTHWHYSAGVDVQARLVEVLSGQDFADYVREHIFAPLGMADSGWKRGEADLPRLARIYVAGGEGALKPMPRESWLEPNFKGKPMTMGGSGIVTTVDDYMRFARMLLGEGTLDGVRILKPSTVRLMATDHLDPRIPAANRLWLPGKGSGGFGFDVFVRTAQPQTPQENRGAVGEFFWDGYPSMLFWVDPVNDMAVVFATQKVPFDNALHHDFRDAVYGADYLGPEGD